MHEPVARSARTPSIDRTLAAITLAVVAAFFVIGPVLVAVFVGLAFVLAGMPHGALDVALIEGSRVRFYATYLAAAFAAVGAWFVDPAAALVAFVAGSAFHFGESELTHLRLPDGWRPWAYLSRGLVIVGIPPLAHPGELATFLHELGLGAELASVDGTTAVAAIALIVVQHAALLYALQRRRWLSTFWHEVMIASVLLVLLVALPPVLSIGLYLSTWHAAAHGLAVLRRAPRPVPVTRTWAIATALGFVALASAGLLWFVGGFALRSSSVLTVLTITVSALTLPHAITVTRWHGSPRTTSTRADARRSPPL